MATSRDRLLDAAARLFHEKGYDGTTTREIGAEAGVDAALIARHFGNKAGLYVAAVRAETGEQAPPDLLADGRVGALLARADAQGPGPVYRVTVAGEEDPSVLAVLREQLTDRLLDPLRSRLTGPDAELRAQVLVAAFAGIVTARAAGTLSALAQAPAEQVERLTDRLLRTLDDA